MRNFVITVNGKSYEVGVEEVGSAASAPVVSAAVPQTAAPAVQEPKAVPQTAPTAPKATPANGEKVLSPFPGLIKSLLGRRRSNGEEGSTYSCTRSDEDG